ncbi:MAG TPA: acetamidase/formamidase family protein [Gaiellaceae bacterium]
MAATIHAVHADRLHYAWDNALEPALRVSPGEQVRLHVRDASDGQLGPDSTAADVSRLDFDRVNPVSGPVYVEGARPGDVLAVEILDFARPSWGWTAIIPGFGLLADEFAEPWLRISTVDGDRVRFSDRIGLPLRPFPGTLGLASPEPGPHSILPPSRFGGNVDCKHLTPGAVLYLPVGVEGALFSLGDTHAAQGDGEVCGTAIETAMETTVRLDVRRDLRLDAPQVDLPRGLVADQSTSPYRICTGVGADLLEASRDAVRAGIAWLGEEHGLEREEAYALLSVAADLRIHEVVDAPNWVVGICTPLAIFEP